MKISVIIPIYNVGEYLEQCIDSVINQTYKDLEIILVNDGSTDNCPAICDKYARIDSRIIVIHKTNGGLSDARNAGLKVATGEYIGFVDSDDYIVPDMYSILMSKIAEYGSDIVSCKFDFLMDDQIKQCPWPSMNSYIEGKVVTLQDFFTTLINGDIDCACWNKLYKKEIINESFKKGRIAEDFLFLSNICKKHPTSSISTTSHSLYIYRQQRNNRICNDTISVETAIIDNLNEIISDIRSWYPKAYDIVNKRINTKLLHYIRNLSSNKTNRNKYRESFERLHRQFCNIPINEFPCRQIEVIVLKYAYSHYPLYTYLGNLKYRLTQKMRHFL